MSTARIESAIGAPPLEVAPGIFMSLPALLTVDDSPSLGLQTKIEFAYNFSRREVQATVVAVASPPDGEPVTGTDLRGVRVAELTAEHLPKLARKYDNSPVMPDSTAIADLVASGPSNGQTLQLVADLYQYARAVGMKPAKHVQVAMGLSSATASRWIRRARDAGLFEPAVFTIEDDDHGDD